MKFLCVYTFFIKVSSIDCSKRSLYPVNELEFILTAMAVNFVIVVIWYQQLVRGLVKEGKNREELAINSMWLQFVGASKEVKRLLVRFYIKLFVLLLCTYALYFIVGF